MKIGPRTIAFVSYAVLSAGFVASLLWRAVMTQKNYYDACLLITSSKVNLVMIFNMLLVVLLSFARFLVWLFFGQIRTNESEVSKVFLLQETNFAFVASM